MDAVLLSMYSHPVADLGRREFLRTAGSGVLLAGLAPLGYELVRATDTRAAVDPRVRALARSMRGPVYAQGSSGYASASQVYNALYAGYRPLAVAQPVSVADVQACVRWALRYRVHIVPRSGGHSYAGYSTGNGVLQVDLRRLGGVSVDGGTGTAVVGPGALLMQVYAGLANSGVAIPAGSCPTVGVGGLALGGGHGLASRAWGVTSDNIVAVGIVLADGSYVTARSSTSYDDLLWACQGGGGGSFGIVTSFRFRVHPVRSSTRFFLSWPWSQAEEVLAAWQSWAPSAPDAVDSILNLSTNPGQPFVHCVGQYLGSPGPLSGLLAPIRRVGSPSVSVVQDSWLNVQKWMAGCSGQTVNQCLAFQPTLFAGKSHYFRQSIPASGRAAVVQAINQAQGLPGGGALILDAYGGAINRVAPGATAFVHRQERFSGQFYASWGSSRNQGTMISWLRGFHAAMSRYASGYAYQNYIDFEQSNWQHAYYGSNFDHLVDVKTTYDPNNVFRFAQSIPVRQQHHRKPPQPPRFTG